MFDVLLTRAFGTNTIFGPLNKTVCKPDKGPEGYGSKVQVFRTGFIGVGAW